MSQQKIHEDLESLANDYKKADIQIKQKINHQVFDYLNSLEGIYAQRKMQYLRYYFERRKGDLNKWAILIQAQKK